MNDFCMTRHKRWVAGGSVKAEGIGDSCIASQQDHRQAALDATTLEPDTYSATILSYTSKGGPGLEALDTAACRDRLAAFRGLDLELAVYE